MLHRTTDDLDITTLTASDIVLKTNSSERLRIGSAGQIGLAGANYGTAGQVLSSQGASAAPQWADAGGGQWTLLESATSTSNVQTIDTLGGANGLTQYSGTYKWFKMEIAFHRAGSSEDHIGLKLSVDGSSWLSTNYRCEEFYGQGGSWAGTQHGNEARFAFCKNVVRPNYTVEVNFYDPFITTYHKAFFATYTGWYNDTQFDLLNGVSSCGYYGSNAAITGIQLFTDSSYGSPFSYKIYAHA